MIGARLGDARRDGADPDFGDQLDRDARALVDVLEVVDELGDILDRIDIVVRRRRDQRYTGGGEPQPGDLLGDLVAGQLAALAGLGPLGHFNLKLVRVDQIFDRHPETALGHLLDAAAAPIAIRIFLKTHRILATLTSI